MNMIEVNYLLFLISVMIIKDGFPPNEPSFCLGHKFLLLESQKTQSRLKRNSLSSHSFVRLSLQTVQTLPNGTQKTKRQQSQK